MPVTGPNSYPSAISQFLSHWQAVNTFLGTPLTISGGRTVGNLETWLQTSTDQIAETTQEVVTASNRKSELDQKKANLLRWTVKFNETMRTDHGDMSYIRNLVPAPKLSAGRGSFTTPLNQTLQIWEDVNTALGADLALVIRTVLPTGIIQNEEMEIATYDSLVDGMGQKWNEWVMADQKASNVREKRNDTHKLAYDCMRDYRQKAQQELPAGHALLDSLPLLNPDSANNPDAPEASGEWNPATQKADLTGTESTSAGVTHTDVRFCPDGTYDVENEIVLVSIPTGDPLIYSTDIGLGIVGDKARFTLVAVKADGSEGRSPVVEVERLT